MPRKCLIFPIRSIAAYCPNICTFYPFCCCESSTYSLTYAHSLNAFGPLLGMQHRIVEATLSKCIHYHPYKHTYTQISIARATLHIEQQLIEILASGWALVFIKFSLRLSEVLIFATQYVCINMCMHICIYVNVYMCVSIRNATAMNTHSCCILKYDIHTPSCPVLQSGSHVGGRSFVAIVLESHSLVQFFSCLAWLCLLGTRPISNQTLPFIYIYIFALMFCFHSYWCT